jgi:hypothetical protein
MFVFVTFFIIGMLGLEGREQNPSEMSGFILDPNSVSKRTESEENLNIEEI